MTEGDQQDYRAIVRPARALEHFTLARWDPAPPLDRFVDRFWKTCPIPSSNR